MSIPSFTQDVDERRNYYRIDDTVLLNYRIIPEQQLAEFLERFHDGSEHYYFSKNYVEGDKLMAEAITSIRMSQPAVAIYLEELDRKINMLAHFIMSQNDAAEEYPERQVNVSGGGIAFNIEHEISTATNVELKLVLLPRYQRMLIHATVIYCRREANPALPWRVGLTFTNIRETDRDLLIRHVLYRQAEWIRHHHQNNQPIS